VEHLVGEDRPAGRRCLNRDDGGVAGAGAGVVGDGQGHGVGAGCGVGLGYADAAAGGAVAEVPGVAGDGAVRVAGAGAGEGHCLVDRGGHVGTGIGNRRLIAGGRVAGVAGLRDAGHAVVDGFLVAGVGVVVAGETVDLILFMGGDEASGVVQSDLVVLAGVVAEAADGVVAVGADDRLAPKPFLDSRGYRRVAAGVAGGALEAPLAVQVGQVGDVAAVAVRVRSADLADVGRGMVVLAVTGDAGNHRAGLGGEYCLLDRRTTTAVAGIASGCPGEMFIHHASVVALGATGVSHGIAVIGLGIHGRVADAAIANHKGRIGAGGVGNHLMTAKTLLPLLGDQLMVPSLMDQIAMTRNAIADHNWHQRIIRCCNHLVTIETLLTTVIDQRVVSFGSFSQCIVVAPPAIALNERKGIGLRNRRQQKHGNQRKHDQDLSSRAIFRFHLFPPSTPRHNQYSANCQNHTDNDTNN